jgi:hypothetical protein
MDLNNQLTASFRTYCKNYIADGRFPQPELVITGEDWSQMYRQYNYSLCENVTDVLERYMRRFLKNCVKQYGKSYANMRDHLKSIIADCINNDLMRSLPN